VVVTVNTASTMPKPNRRAATGRSVLQLLHRRPGLAVLVALYAAALTQANGPWEWTAGCAVLLITGVRIVVAKPQVRGLTQ
jgi:hypothetical protein